MNVLNAISKVGAYGFGAAVFVLAVLALVFTPVPRGTAVRNQIEVALLLSEARLEMTTTAPPRIQRVRLSDSVTLIPEHEQIAVGYVLTLHVDVKGGDIAHGNLLVLADEGRGITYAY